MKETAVIVALLCATACSAPPVIDGPTMPVDTASVAHSAGPVSSKPAVARASLPQLSHDEFNRLALLEDVELYWRDPPFEPTSFVIRTAAGAGDTDLSLYVVEGQFTDAFDALVVKLVNRKRIELVERDLNHSKTVTLVTDLRQDTDADRELARRMAAAGALIEEIYRIQNGTAAVGETPNDAPSRALLRRNQTLWCRSAETRNDPFCGALISYPKQVSDAYPRDVVQDKAFCESLRSADGSKELMAPFAVVRRREGQLVAVPYTEVYGSQMRAIAVELKAAAAALGPDEAALATYLQAAAAGFETNNWDAADEAWAAMTSHNSKWYLRIGPDETYFDPCGSKAGFALTFGRIDPSLLGWQDKLTPLRGEMEGDLAKLIGAPYKAREVAFALPDFIAIVLNAGDSRKPFGATIGQSLPNWGPVAQRSGGRTIVMTNLYGTRETRAVKLAKARLLLDPVNLEPLEGDDNIAAVVEILLHEASHNLGPHMDYKVGDKSPKKIFGGRSASILEELKAQTGAMWFTDWLRARGLLTDAQVRASHTHSIMWCMGQLAKGFRSKKSGKRRTYPTVAAIQIGTFLDAGALVFDPSMDPDHSGEPGRFRINYDKLPAAVAKLMATAGAIKARGDKAAADALMTRYADGDGPAKVHQAVVADRVLRFRKPSFGYSIVY